MAKPRSEYPSDWKTTGTERVRGDGKDLILTMAQVPVQSLTPDPKNKRLHTKSMEKYGGEPLTTEQCFEELWAFSSVKQLYQGILVAGGISEALIVQRNGLTVEGNERLTALNQIKKELESGDVFSEGQTQTLQNLIENVPVKILPDDVTPRELALMLADWHLGGKDPWDSVNQARHVYEMHNDLHIPIQDISYTLRKSRPWVYQRIQAYNWANEHFERGNRWDKTKEFSYFEELYKKKKKLAEQGFDVEANQEDLHQFMDWVANGQIPRALDVRKLPKVLEYEATRELLYNSEGKKAFSELKHYDATETSPRFAAINRMNTQLDRMTWNEYKMISENPHLRDVIEMSIKRLNQVLESVDSTEWGGK